jgi:hypothetical protein
MATAPSLSGRWCVREKSLMLDNENAEPDIDDPVKTHYKVEIRQNNRFFSWIREDAKDDPLLGVFERVHIGDFVGWKAHLVVSDQSNTNYLLNFTKIREDGNQQVVKEFELTITESGFETGNGEQNPRVATGVGTRIGC